MLSLELLAFVGRGKTLTAEEVAGSFPNTAAALNALKGCLAKHFVTQDGAGHLVLTEAGKRQV